MFVWLLIYIFTPNLEDISVVEFSLHVKEMHKEADEAFEEEYKSISDGKYSWSEGVKASNEIKNRFTNIFPCTYVWEIYIIIL